MIKKDPLQKSGFTLIELLIVVAIIAILAAIAVPNFLEAQTRSKVSRTLADIRTMRTALESYAVDYNKYPETDRGAVANNVGTVTGTAPNQVAVINAGTAGFRSILRLTSPIAYITGFPRSPWKETYSTAAGDAKIASAFTTYLYVGQLGQAGSFQLDNGIANNGANQEYEDDRRAYIRQGQISSGAQLAEGSWLIKSVGPDAVDNRSSTAENAGARLYDPTNGTVSRGDIVLFSDLQESRSQ
ncbi:MAG: prepilin-type N-terminal cleavage/methylation domain-containing protein [Candidatus Sumerlaeia bacterium]|nr:prepilin-type N-terminal cleavage/methylation domain-containing protein [Candidatus Sumerlaeia bacterium]